jgi:hypothetical protein
MCRSENHIFHLPAPPLPYSSHDMPIFTLRNKYLLILHYFNLFYVQFVFISPSSFSLIFLSHFLLLLPITYFPPMTLADILPLPGGGGGRIAHYIHHWTKVSSEVASPKVDQEIILVNVPGKIILNQLASGTGKAAFC